MLKHLPPNAVNTLLQALNNIWFAGNCPQSWCTSTVIPIPKHAIDASDPNNYRPIAVTSCLCKVMERMVNNRLVWFLDRNKLITPLQCGFRKQRSTTDHLVSLESFIREAFIQRQHAVFFDLDKDCTWKYGIMNDLHQAGLRGRLPCFIGGFLTIDSFQSA